MLESHILRFEVKLSINLLGTCSCVVFGYSEVDEIHRICAVIGSPSHHTWSDGMKLAASLNFQFPQVCIYRMM